ncbi:tetratricopeptide repeat protein [Phocaeicola sp.]|jgi:predicted Zn-dependent protease|uniref:tetratricopeptide repeat protein n=1 Tax=Phocaeicola sp. TaxID=2773926 RepID=UPI003AB44AA8
MKDDLSSIFHKPEFKQLLAKYSDMIENHTSIYLEPDEITLLAEFYASMGNIKACEEVVDYGVMLHPDNPDILIFKCHNLIIKGHTHEAQKLLNSIADPNDYEVRLLQAELYLAQKRNQEADELLNQLYQDEKNTDTMLDIAHLYMDGHQKKNAYYWLQKASNEDPDNLGLLEELASYHFSFGNVEEAVDLYNRLLDEAPYTIDFWHNLIRCYLRMYKPEKAMEAIDFAMAIDDTNLITWELKSNALLLENEIDKAMECLFYIEKHTTEKPYIQNIIMSIYFFMQNYQKVLEYADKITTSNNLANFEMASLYHKKGYSRLQLGDLQACEEDIEQGLAYDNHNSDLYLLKGELELINGRMEEAQQSFHYGRLFAEDEADSLSYIGNAYFRHECWQQALNYFKEQEELASETMHVHYYQIAYCYYQLGLQDEMFTYLVRGAIFSSELLKMEGQNNSPFSQGVQFLEQAKDVFTKIENGEINPMKYLQS